MAYYGTFIVLNGTDQAITHVTVTHKCHDFLEAATAPHLGPGQAISAKLSSQSGSPDVWSVNFTMEGTVYSRAEKQCNYLPEDENQPAVVILYRRSFSIITPVSSPCLNNSYVTPASVRAPQQQETTGGEK